MSQSKTKAFGTLPFLFLCLFLFFHMSHCSLYLQVSIVDGQKQINSNGTYMFTLLPSQTTFTAGTTFKTYYPSSIVLQPKASGSLNMCSQYVSQSNTFTNFTCTYDTTQNMVQFILTSSISFTPVFVYEIGYFKNPAVAETITGFRVVVLDATNTLLYNSSESSSTATTLPNSIINQSLTVLSNQTGATTTYSFKFGIQDSIPANGKVVITFPTSYISVPSSIRSSNTLITIYSGSAQTGSITSTTSTITFNNFPSGLTADTSKFITITINDVVNPYSLQPTSSFSIATVDSSGNQIDSISSGLTVTLTVPSQITIVNVGPQTNPQVGQISDINFNIILPYVYSSGGYLSVIFPSEISIVGSTLSCPPIIGFSTSTSSCSYISSSIPQNVKISNPIASDDIYFLISNVQNPLSTKLTSSFQIYAYDPQGYLTSQVTSGANYSVSAGSLSSVSVTRAYSTVGESSGNYATISFTTQNVLSSSQFITFKIPYEQFLVASTSSFKVYYNNIVQTYVLDITSDSTHFIFNVSAPCTSTCSATTTFYYSIYGIQNPLSITNPAVNSVQIYTVTSDKLYLIDEVVSGVYATPSLVPGTLSNEALSKDSYIVGEEAQYQFSITLQNPIPANGLIRLYFPTYAVFYPSSGIPYCINRDASNSYLEYSYSSYTSSLQGIYYLEVDNRCPSGCTSSQTLDILFTNLLNPGSVKPITNSFYIATYTSTLQLIDAINITDASGLQLQASPFESLSILSPVSPIVTGSYSSYKLQIQSQTGIVYSTGLLQVTFPSKCLIPTTTTTCKATSNGYTLSCSVDQTNNRVKIVNNQAYQTFANQNILLEVDNVRNPNSTQQTTDFIFESMLYDSGSAAYYDVDYDDSSISITPDTPNSLTSVSVVRSATQINTASSFTIDFTNTNPIPIGSSIFLYLPLDQLVIPSTDALSFTDNIYQQTVSLRSESSNSTYSILELKEWCSLGADCPSFTLLSLTIAGVENPGSTSAPSNSFQIIVQVSTGVITDEILSGVYATPLLSSGPFQSVTFAQADQIVGDYSTSSYYLQMSIVSQDFISNTQASFQFTFPNDFLYLNSISGSNSPYCLMNGVNTSCAIKTATGLLGGSYISQVNLTYSCVSIGGCLANTDFVFQLWQARNRFSSANFTLSNGGTGGSFILYSTDQNGNAVDASIISFANTGLTAQLSPSSRATVNSLSVNNNTVGASTDITVYFAIGTRLAKGSWLEVYIPLDAFTFFSVHTFKCFTIGSIVQVTCSSGTINSTHYGVMYQENCVNTDYCPDGYVFSIVIRGFQNRYSTAATTSSVYVNTYTTDGVNLIEYNGQSYVPAISRQAALIAGISYSFSSYVYIGNALNFLLEFNLLNTLSAGDTISIYFSTNIFLGTLNEVCYFQSELGATTLTSCTIQNGQNTLAYEAITQIAVTVPYSVDFNKQVSISINNLENFFEVTQIGTTITVNATSSDGSKIGNGSSVVSASNILKPLDFTKIYVSRVDGITDYATPVSINLTFTYPIPILQNSIMSISVPLTQFLQLDSTVTCSLNGLVEVSCSITSSDTNYYYLSIPLLSTLCYPGQTTCASSSYTSFFIISGFQNPYQSSSNTLSFNMSISHNSNQVLINPQTGGISSIFATPALQINYFSGITVYQNTTYVTGNWTSYLFYFHLPEVIESDSMALIQFPDQTISIQNKSTLICSDSTEKITFTCSYTTSTLGYVSSVTFSNLCEKLNCTDYQNLNVTLKIKQIINVEFVRPRNDSFGIYIVTPAGYTLYQGNVSESSLPAFQPQNISNFTATRSKNVVGGYGVQVTLSFITPNRILDGSYIYLTIPFEQVEFQDYTNIDCGYGQYAFDTICDYVNSTADNVTIRLVEYCDGDCPVNTTLTYYLKSTINPPSLASNYPTSKIFINVTTSTNEIIEEYVGGVTVGPTLAGITITKVLLQRQNNLIGAVDYLVLSIPLTSLLDSSTYITLSLPSLIAMQQNVSSSPQTISCDQLISNTWQSRSCSYTYYNGTSSSYSQYGRQALYNLTMTSICLQAGVCQPSQNLNLRFKVRNPFTQYQDSSSSFNLYFFTGQYLLGYAQVANNLSQLNPNQIVASINQTSTNKSTNSCQMTGAECSAWININTSNPVPSTNNSGWLVINVPSQMAIQASTCIGYLFNTISVTCKVTGGFQIQVKHNSVISNSTLSYQFQIYLQQLQNPFSTELSDSFVIGTYQLIQKTNYQIDLVSSGLTYQVSQPNSFSSISIVRSDVQILDSTQLSFTLVNTNYMPLNSSILINIPSTQAIVSSGTNNQVNCQSAFTTGLSCSLYNSTALQVQNICKSSSGCEAFSTIVFSVDSSYITNPSYVKDPYSAADSIGILSMFDVNGTDYFIDQTLSGVFITPALTPVDDMSITSISISGYNTSQIVNMTIQVNKKVQGETFTEDYLRVKFDGSIFNLDPYYSIAVSINGGTPDYSIMTQADQNKSISYIVFQCQTNTCQGQSSLTILIQNLQNPYYIQSSYDSDSFLLLVEELYSSPDQVYGYASQDLESPFMTKLLLSPFTNIQVFQSTGNLSSQDSISLEFSFSNNPYIPADTIISLGLPTGFSVNTSALVCGNIFNASATGYSCLYSSVSNMILIDNYFNDSSFNTQPIETIALSIAGIVNPPSAQDGFIKVSIYDADAYYGLDTTNFKVKAQLVNSNCSADPNCAICGSDGTCYSCKVPSDAPFLVNNACSKSCPTGYYEADMKCYQCAAGCSTCQTYDSCSTCESPLLFIDGLCINGSCPQNTTLNANNQCARTNGCESKCKSCGLSSTYCYQCVNPLLSLNGDCESSCPSSYYVSNQTCLICNSLCKECAYNADYCTECNGANETNEHILDLSINSCVASCSASAYPSLNDSNVCDPCSASCQTCLGTADNCTSCYYDKSSKADVFYYDGECLESCPAGLYQNYSDHECTDNPFIWTSLPPLYLISSVGLTTAVILVSKVVATKAAVLSDVSGLFIVGLTQIEFLNRVMTIGNLWFSTKTMSFCVTGLNIVANSLMGVYFATLIVSPMASQIQGATSGMAFTLAVGLSQITGINSIRLVTSGFFGVPSLSNGFAQIPYYNSQLEFLSLMSGGLSLFQMATGVSQFFDFSKGSDAFGFGANSLVLNSALLGLQAYKYMQAAKAMKAYSAVAT